MKEQNKTNLHSKPYYEFRYFLCKGNFEANCYLREFPHMCLFCSRFLIGDCSSSQIAIFARLYWYYFELLNCCEDFIDAGVYGCTDIHIFVFYLWS